MQRELSQAAKRGVDVRIITPGIPDKKLVYQVTRSYYAGLVKNGVRIYEYTPGFIHAKQCICDDEVATVGTINLDFRSLYFHFENGTYLYKCSAIGDIKKDFDDTFPICTEVTDKYKNGRSAVLRIWQCILRLFAPLL
jgi:cardiolipin synthase